MSRPIRRRPLYVAIKSNLTGVRKFCFKVDLHISRKAGFLAPEYVDTVPDVPDTVKPQPHIIRLPFPGGEQTPMATFEWPRKR